MSSPTTMDYSFIDAELEKKIKETKFVFLVARAATGKTFSGDYLETVRGWKHVDGDTPLKQMAANPLYKEPAGQMFGIGDFEGKTDFWKGVLDHQKPYFDVIARLALEAAKDSNKVVLTFAAYFRSGRDYLRKLLKDAGATDVSTVFLETDPEPHAKAFWERLNRQATDSGIPLAGILKIWMCELDELNLENFTRWFVEESPVYSVFEELQEEEEGPCSVINNTAKDATVLESLDAAFGVDADEPPLLQYGTYQELAEAIKAIEALRDMASYELMNDFLEKDAETNEDAKAELEMAKTEPKKLAARRSSLLDAQKVEGLRRLSLLAHSGKNRRRSSNFSTGSRRASFILLGKVEDEYDEVDTKDEALRVVSLEEAPAIP